MTTAHFHSYRGSPETPFPPMAGAWAVVGWADGVARARAAELARVLPLWHYADELTSQGFYRYFHVQGSDGTCGVCAVKMHARGAGTLGADDPTLDQGANAGASGAEGSSSSDGGDFEGSTSTAAATTDTSSGLQEGDSSNTDISPPQGGGGPSTTPTKPAAPPAPSSGSSSSSGGLVAGVIAALAVTGVIVAAAAAKHPVRHH